MHVSGISMQVSATRAQLITTTRTIASNVFLDTAYNQVASLKRAVSGRARKDTCLCTGTATVVIPSILAMYAVPLRC